jgi:hypothetical protein
MADIRCPNCGKDNPDSLDLCQFCQSPLKPESSLQIGQKPTKKNTGELEPILPDWLRDVRQQARESAEATAAQEAAHPKVQKNEAPDLLAGLASQARSDDDEIPDWLAGISPTVRAKPSDIPSREPGADPLAQVSEPSQEQKDELSEWFSRTSEQTGEPFTVEPDESQYRSDWVSNLDASEASLQQPAPPQEEEDLSWLRNLEASSKQSSEPSEAQQDLSWMRGAASSQPASKEEDLSWLDNLGGIAEPSHPFDQTQGGPASAQPAVPEEDMSWLDNLGGTPKPSQPTQPSAAQEDLSWLDNLGRTSEPSQQESTQPSSPQDLSWLNDLGETAGPSPSESASPPAAQEDLSWLNDTRESNVTDPSSAIFSPRRTAPLSGEPQNESVPDWLKSATEEPSMPPLGAGALDWFASHGLEEDRVPAAPESSTGKSSGLSEESSTLPFAGTQEEPVVSESDIFTSPGESQPATNQDVDSLLSMNMPDWLTNPGELGASDVSVQPAETPSTENAESLAPVELPSWVQAMRPVEAVISETASGVEAQAPEREGPLAGLRGVIPLLPIGSSRRPKALSLTLQATDEQQASAGLLEQILAGETAPRPTVTSAFLNSQRVLRWALTGLVIIVLGAMIGLRSQSLPVSTALPAEVGSASNAIAALPENAPVLVVLDYEPSLAAEMEAVSGPFLDNVVLLRHPNLSFLSTSPNGSALVERLMTNTKINRPAPEGLGYQAGQGYFNLGYLPGGSTGVLAFMESPPTAIRSADVLQSFSEYAAVIVLTDHAESGRVWVEQLDARKQSDPVLASQPLLLVASAQAGPLLQPYVSSRQVTSMISGLSDAARYESVNNVPPGIARTYWDAFGVGLLMAVILITFGGLWSLFTGIRPRRAGAE